MGSTSQYRASRTLAWAVTDCGSWRRMPAAWVRHCVAKKMVSCSSIGRDPKERRWNNWSGVARGFVMCDMVANILSCKVM